jgi:hypothetical protein
MSEQAIVGDNAHEDCESVEISALKCDLALPLVLDLDGTLVATDTLHEALFLLFKRVGRRLGGFRFGRSKGAPS